MRNKIAALFLGFAGMALGQGITPGGGGGGGLGPVTLTGTPAAGNLIVATSPTAATWQAPAGSFSQAVTAVSSIAITHSLNTSQPWVTCFDASGNILGGATASTQITNIVATSANIATVTFNGSTTGTCVVSSGSMGPTGSTGATGATGPAGAPHTLNFTITQTGQLQAGTFGNFACTINGWSVVGNSSGSLTMEIDAHASSAPPVAPTAPNTSTDKISASAPITVSAAQTASSGTSGVSTWTTSRVAYDSFAGNVTAFSGFTSAVVTVFCQ